MIGVELVSEVKSHAWKHLIGNVWKHKHIHVLQSVAHSVFGQSLIGFFAVFVPANGVDASQRPFAARNVVTHDLNRTQVAHFGSVVGDVACGQTQTKVLVHFERAVGEDLWIDGANVSVDHFKFNSPSDRSVEVERAADLPAVRDTVEWNDTVLDHDLVGFVRIAHSSVDVIELARIEIGESGPSNFP